MYYVLCTRSGDIILGMTEGIPEGDEVRRIIINAKGEVKNVVPSVSEPQNESETSPQAEPKPSKKSSANAAETVAKIGAGIAVGEIGEALINQGAKAIRKVIWGEGSKRGKSRVNTGGEPPKEPPSGGKPPENKNGDENDPIKNAYFAKVMSMSNDPTLSVKDRAPWVKEKESRIEEFKKFDEGDFVADTRERFQTLMRTSGWDKEGGNGVYDKLVEFSENRDNDYKNRHGSELRLRGLLGIAIRSEAARVLVAGVDNKLRGITTDSDVDSWLSGKHYTDEELNRLSRLAKDNHIFDFGTDAPEELVGSLAENVVSNTREAGSSGTDRLADILERANPSPEKQRMSLFDVEENGEEEVKVPPLNSVLWEGLSEGERKLWQARLQLSNARWYKQSSGEDLSRNKALSSLTKESLQTLMSAPGVNEALSMYVVFIVDPDFSENLKDRLGFDETRFIWKDVEVSETEDKNKPRTLGQKIGTYLKSKFSKKVKVTIGVDDETKLKKMREQVRSYLTRRLRLDDEQARTAEQIAYNFTYVSNVAEGADHSGDPRSGKMINEGLRDMMHPNSKLLDAIQAGGGKGDRWPPNIMGEWAWYNRKRLIKHWDQIPLTDDLTGSFLSIPGAAGRGIQKELGMDLQSYYLEQGRQFLTDHDFDAKFRWNDPVKADETPFGRYLAVRIGRASQIFDTIRTGEPPRDRTVESIQNAFRSLGTDRKTRETILWLIYYKVIKVNNFLLPKKHDFKPNLDPIDMWALMERARREYPGYFS